MRLFLQIRNGLLAFLAACVLAGVPVSRAAEAMPDTEARAKADQIFRKGQKCYEDLNYPCAEANFREALNYTDEARFHVHLAYTYAATDRQKLAVDEFVKALALDPEVTVDSKTQSPKIVRAYDLAREQARSARETARENIFSKGSAFIDELFRDTISTVTKPFIPEQPQGLVWKDTQLTGKSRYSGALGLNIPVNDEYAGRGDAFEPDLALMGSYAYHPKINHFAFGGRVIYSRNKQRDKPGPVSLDIMSATGFLELHHPVDAFLLFARAEAGTALSGIDSLTEEQGFVTGGCAGVSALVTDRVSLEISGTFQAMFGAGIPGKDATFRTPFFFGLNYLY